MQLKSFCQDLLAMYRGITGRSYLNIDVLYIVSSFYCASIIEEIPVSVVEKFIFTRYLTLSLQVISCKAKSSHQTRDICVSSRSYYKNYNLRLTEVQIKRLESLPYPTAIFIFISVLIFSSPDLLNYLFIVRSKLTCLPTQ